MIQSLTLFISKIEVRFGSERKIMEVYRNGWKNCNLKQMEKDAYSEIKNVFTNIYYLSWLLLLLLLVFNGKTEQHISNK